MKRSSALAGIVGIILIIFGLLDYFIAASFRIFFVVNVVAGVFSLVIWATTSSREALGATLGRRSTRYGANAVVYTFAAIGVLVALNYLSFKRHTRFDTTEERVFSLSSQSTNVVKDLTQPLKLYGFFEGGENPRAHALFDSYAYASKHVSYEMVDPDKHPELAEKFKVSVMGTTHIQYGDSDHGEGTNVTELSEENITNGIIKVTKGGKETLYFLDGHGESDPDDTQTATGMASLKQALEGEGYTVKKLMLASLPQVPNDCNVLIVSGPKKPLLPHELDALNKYLWRGGRMIVMLEPARPEYDGAEDDLIKMVGDWGIKAGNDVVVDQVVRLFAGPALGLSPIVSKYGVHPVTHDFTQRTVFPMTRSVEPGEHKNGITVTELAKTSESSWAETDVQDIFKKQTATLDDKDKRGPVGVADAVDIDLKTLGKGQGNARLVVFGSTNFADNQYLNNFFNRDFFINSVDWLAGEEKSISIRPRSLRASRFRLTVDQFSVVFALSVLLLPEMLLITGIAVWWERRN